MCNRFHAADATLSRLGVYAGKFIRPLEFSEIAQEVCRNRVIVARLRWDFGGGHLVAISGYADNGDLWIEDPLHGHGSLSHTEFRDRFLGWGRWSHTYLTSPPR